MNEREKRSRAFARSLKYAHIAHLRWDQRDNGNLPYSAIEKLTQKAQRSEQAAAAWYAIWEAK